MDDFAPVLIPTLNRHVHFRCCVESLSVCTHADKTDLFIFLDYPLKDTHWEGYELIKAYLPNIKGFKTVNVIKREKNYGAVENIIRALEYVFEKYDKMIFSEDDNVFSPNFLDYQNKCLDKFKDDKKVKVVCGYSCPIEISGNFKYDYYYSKHQIAWGMGIWKNKKIFILDSERDKEIKKINNYLQNPFKAYNLLFMPYYMLTGLIDIVKTGIFTDDRYISFKNLTEGTYCVCPKLSLVRNHGHDGSGVHCGTIIQNPFVKQIIDTRTEFIFELHNDYENTQVKKAIKKYVMEFQYYNFRSKISLLKSYLLFIVKYDVLIKVAKWRFMKILD